MGEDFIGADYARVGDDVGYFPVGGEGEGFAEKAGLVIPIGSVAFDEFESGKFGLEILAVASVEVADHDFEASGDESVGVGFADAIGAAGDDGGFVLEVGGIYGRFAVDRLYWGILGHCWIVLAWGLS